MKIKTRDITVLGAALALMFALTPIPLVGLFLVPVLFIGATHKWHLASITGLMFGLVSLMYAFVGPGAVTPVAAVFMQNPWVPIVPRIVVGLAASLSFWGFRKLIPPKGKISQALPYHLSATLGTLTNTALVVPLLIWLGGDLVIPALAQIAIAAVIELVVANVIAAPITRITAKAIKIGEFADKKKIDIRPPEPETKTTNE